MTQPRPKRRGPLLWLAGRSRSFWIGTAVILPVSYLVTAPICFALFSQWFSQIPRVMHNPLRAYCSPYFIVAKHVPLSVSDAMGSYFRSCYLTFHPSHAASEVEMDYGEWLREFDPFF